MKTISDDLKFFIENSKKSQLIPTQALIAFFETPLDKAYEMGGI